MKYKMYKIKVEFKFENLEFKKWNKIYNGGQYINDYLKLSL